MSRGKQLEDDDRSRKEQLQKEKAELNKQGQLLQDQQRQVQSELRTLSQREAELQRKTRDVETEKLLLAQDRAVLKPPYYWQSQSSGTSADIKVDLTSEWKDRIQELMTSTCKSQYLGQGRNNKGLKYKGYEVERVFRIEHAGLWSAYALERRSIGQLMLQQGNRHPKTKVSTCRDWMKSSLLQDKTSNEAFLFHGTKHDMADAILKSGLDERVCSLEGLFGAGVYLAENSSKSDEYCTPDSHGICRMLLVRVALGTPFEALQTMRRARRPPAMPGSSRLHDSVMAVTRDTHPQACLDKHREFIVYDRRQTYPELLIEFRRV
ncbi:hypothetical protein GUITHDRAFT_82501 [Guillardia theta CCMP2712]|uniref:Poly [ADP-ribose] polymerase n=1 Tax=Guillardia theta (strain CCMP2712) TaxID=905079 RepID=L1I825_GUITC|nr:hypothetical protein GUITHDRAFT_82501 [Guillardia theta CCMP2712]EKX32232.1 hypothetical protein GUITHDRAFT_82501 [Guillardia theta CCMP2712]|eukprot:XP_005819212.1 hypothetical protein GUITHDRAFT_82501 [Guillardia theta CCMP2712]